MATVTLYPSGAGDRTEATPSAGANWDCVEETPHDGNTSYVQTGAAASPDEDLYALTNPTFDPTDFINSVTVYVTTQKGGPGSGGSGAACIKENGTDTVGTAISASDEWVERSETWTARPSDGNNWQYDDIVALQAGVRHSVTTGVVSTTQVRVMVDFTASIKPQIIIVTGDD